MRLRLALAFALFCSPAFAQVGQIATFPNKQPVVSAFDPATTAWVSAVTTAGGAVSGTRQTVVNTFITCMKTAPGGSLWATLDRYWLLAGEDEPSALTDMVGPAVAGHTITKVNTPTFTASHGYDAITAGTNNYLNTNYTPSTSGVNYLQNSATFGGQLQTSRGAHNNAPVYGTSNGAFTDISFLDALEFAGAGAFRNNQNAADAATNTDAQGSWIISRTGASAGAAYWFQSTNALSFNITQASTGGSPPVPDSQFFILALSQGGSPAVFDVFDQVSSFFIGGGWTSTQVSSFESCQNAMMTSIGINVH